MTRPDRLPSSSRARQWLIGALALAVAVGASVVVATVVDTAEGRFAGSTSNRGSLLGAGEVELSLVGAPTAADGTDAGGSFDTAEFAVDVSNALPGQKIERCIVIAYRGSVDAVDVRLYGRLDSPVEGGGLERFLDATFDIGTGADPACSDFQRPALDPVTWSGRLSTFAARNNSFADGLPVLDGAPSEATATVRVDLSIVGDNAAQGLTTGFWLVLEVRP